MHVQDASLDAMKRTSARFFIDTNIFVYAFDASDRVKQGQAQELIRHALGSCKGVVSTQVVQEFLNVALRKFEVPLSVSDAARYVRAVFEPLCSVFPTIDSYEHALGLKVETGFQLYDSLIVSAAITAECEVLYSEDLQHLRTVQGTTIRNPFIEGFRW